MTGENEREEEARLLALIRAAFTKGDVPEHLLGVSKEALEALDPEKVARLKALVKSGDLAGLKAGAQTPAESPLARLYRKGKGEAEAEDKGLDAARKRVADRVRREQRDAEPPQGSAGSE